MKPAETRVSLIALTTTCPTPPGWDPVPANNPNGIRWSTALGYLDMSRHRLNLTIRPNCTVNRLIFDGTRATGVDVESGGEKFTAEGEEIILSSGAIGSPQILMLSGVGPAESLRSLGIPVVHDLPRSRREPARPPYDLRDLPDQKRCPDGRPCP